jgi:hypothetical protein
MSLPPEGRLPLRCNLPLPSPNLTPLTYCDIMIHNADLLRHATHHAGRLQRGSHVLPVLLPARTGRRPTLWTAGLLSSTGPSPMLIPP